MNFKTVAKAVFFIKDDPTASEHQSDVIEWKGELWFVANRLIPNATGMPVPAEIIPMAKLPHTPFQDGRTRLGTLIPTELGSYPCPQTVRIAFGVVDGPEISRTHVPGYAH